MRNKIPIPSFSAGVSRTTRSRSKHTTRSNSRRVKEEDHTKNDTNSHNEPKRMAPKTRSRKRKTPTAAATPSLGSNESQSQSHSTSASMHRKSPFTSKRKPQCQPNGNGNGNGNQENHHHLDASASKTATSSATVLTTSSNHNGANTSTTSSTSTAASPGSTNNHSTSTGASYLSIIRSIDTVIELHLRRSLSKIKRTGSTSKSTTTSTTTSSISMSLDKFIGLVSKATDSGSYGSTTKAMVHDLVVVYLITASPELVRVHHPNDPNKPDEPQTLKIEVYTHASANANENANSTTSRLELLRNLYKSKWKGWNTKDVQTLQQRIVQERTLKENRVQTRSRTQVGVSAIDHDSSNGNSISSLQTNNNHAIDSAEGKTNSNSNAILTPGMTLQQRIQARSTAKQALEDQHKKNTTLKNEQEANGQGRGQRKSIHLLFADALNLHFRHASKRQRYHIKQHGMNHAKSDAMQSRSAMALRPMPLVDVCTHLSGGSRNGFGVQAFGHGQGQGRKFKKKEVKKILYELVDMVPEWIQIISGKGGASSSTSNRKRERDRGSKNNAIVVIKGGVSYQMVREKLSGRVLRSSNSSTRTSMKLEMADSQVQIKINETKQLPSAVAVDTKSSSLVESRISKPTVDVDPGQLSDRVGDGNGAGRKRRSTRDFVEMIAKQPQTTSKPYPKRSRGSAFATPISIPKMSSTHPSPSQSPTSSHPDYQHDEKDMANDLSLDHGESENKLRVNYNQHMTDADYDGGFVLQTNSTNPRGLKRMFSQLNAGERI